MSRSIVMREQKALALFCNVVKSTLRCTEEDAKAIMLLYRKQHKIKVNLETGHVEVRAPTNIRLDNLRFALAEVKEKQAAWRYKGPTKTWKLHR